MCLRGISDTIDEDVVVVSRVGLPRLDARMVSRVHTATFSMESAGMKHLSGCELLPISSERSAHSLKVG